MHTLAKQIAEDLQTTEAKLYKRLGGLKIGVVCSRCGGTGHYSFNRMDGTRCFGCKGVGVVAPKTDEEWADVAAQAAKAKASGRVDAYLEVLRARARSKDASQRILAAWHDLDSLNGYGRKWNKNPDADCRRRNQVGLDAYEAIHALDKGAKTDWLEFDKALTDGLAAIAAAKAELEPNT